MFWFFKEAAKVLASLLNCSSKFNLPWFNSFRFSLIGFKELARLLSWFFLSKINWSLEDKLLLNVFNLSWKPFSLFFKSDNWAVKFFKSICACFSEVFKFDNSLSISLILACIEFNFGFSFSKIFFNSRSASALVWVSNSIGL